MPLPLIIDCDPGVDDAIALLLSFASPELNLLGITTVAGNVPLAFTEKNARKICGLAGRTATKVYEGCPRPILRSLATAEEIHGETGLNGPDLPEPTMLVQEQHAVNYLIETVLRSPEPITIATLGPLTNLAIALIQEPLIVEKIKAVVMMGGAIAEGNITTAAEFNIYVDPHAAQVVFSSGLNLTLIPLDITHQVLTTEARLARIRAIGTPVSEAAALLLQHYGAIDRQRHNLPGSPLHDPCVIGYLLRPDFFTVQPQVVNVEINDEATMGKTIVTSPSVTSPSVNSPSVTSPSVTSPSVQEVANVNVVKTVNVEGFYDLLIERLAML
jgi:purine nucleosidase